MLVVLWIAIVLQSMLAPAVAIAGARPDFPFLVVLLIALREGPAGGALAGFVAGLFVDLNSAHALGATSLANSVLAFAVGSIADRIAGDSAGARAVVVFLAVALRDVALAAFLAPSGALGAARHFVVTAVPGGLYTALLSPPLLAGAERVIRWPRESGRGHS
jgi:rod shape-determining protein MreD